MKTRLSTLLAVLVLVLLAGGCSALEPDPDPTPGAITFSDDFSFGVAEANWEVMEGHNWEVVPGGENSVFASPRPVEDNTAQRVDLKDVQINRTERVYLKFDLRFTESNHDNAMWFIRLTNEAGGGIAQYDIGVANVQHANALRRGIRVAIAGGDTLQQNDQWTVNDNEWSTYEIRFDGPSITLYENNAIVFDFEDAGEQLFEVVRFISVMSGIEIDNVEVGFW